MSKPDKQWSWGMALGRGTGGAVGGAATGAVMGSLGGPVGAPLGAAIGAAGGFTSGFLGTVLGHWWDLPPDSPELFGSAALYMAVTTGLLSALLFGLTIDRVASDPRIATAAAWGIPSLSSFLASLSRSLIDDFAARVRRRTRQESEYR